MQPDLTEHLISDLRPVKVVTFRLALGVWFAASGVLGTYYTFSIGVRPDIWQRLTDPAFTIGLVLLTVAFVAASIIAVASAFPDRLATSTGRRRLFVATTVVLGVALAAWVQPHGADASSASGWTQAIGCCMRIALGTLPVALFFFVTVSRLAPLRLKTTVGYGLASAMLMVSIVSQLNCAIDGLFHVIVGHGALSATAAGLMFILFSPLVHWYERWRLRRERLAPP